MTGLWILMHLYGVLKCKIERMKVYEIFKVLVLSAILNVNKTNFHRGSTSLNYILEYINLHRNTQLALNYQ